jgi:predicted ATPase/DNA-binding SARP family transcriptional activator
VRIGILGPLEVVSDDGRGVDVGGARLQTLLARLAIDAGRAVSATALADAVWDGDLPADELHALQALVSRLRRALGDSSLIVQNAGGYRLAVEPESVDAYRFERLAARGARSLRDGDPERALTLLDEALALWRGPVLGEAGSAAATLEDVRVSVQADRAQAEIALGRAAGLVGELEALSAEHPLHERIAGQLMSALYASGRQADALAVYERVRARLADELGATPSPELQGIHLSVLQGDETPAPRSRSNLTAPLTSFVGREQELARIGGLLREHRLLTLVGAGGAGKTRLATELGARATALAREGVWLVELAPVGEASGIVPAIIGSLGLREVLLLGSKTAMATAEGSQLLEALADRDTLIVLDNCEHLLEPVAELVDTLLGACPSLRIMCTSREPLAITGEMIVAIPPLELPPEQISSEEALAVPAVRLFADRAAAASAGFTVDDDNVADVIEVCRRVDGLPLAIELAAARLRSMTLAQLASRLDDRFRLLAGGSRTAMARQRTLRAVVDWSWDLLDDSERALLRRLAVFSGGASLDAAESVCGGGPVGAEDVFDLLCALVDKSLVQIDGQRYRLLETIREYGLERLEEASELAATREAHARHFAALAIEAAPHLRSAEQLQWLARLKAEHDNVLAAIRYLGEGGDAATVYRVLVSMLWFWLLVGSRQEVMPWVEFARGVQGEADPLDRLMIDAVYGLAHAIPGGGGQSDPWQALTAMLAQIEDTDLSDHVLLAALRPMLAFATGRERVAELLELSASHPDPWVRATVPFVKVQLTGNDGDIDGMRLALEEALQAFGEIGDRWGLATTLSELSSLRIFDGDLDGAEAAIEQTQSLMDELGASNSGGMVQMRLADLRARRGDLEGARALLTNSLTEQERFAEEAAMLKISLAYVTARLGDTDRARELCAEALGELDGVAARRPEQGHGRAMVLSTVATVELVAGGLEAAQRALREAYPIALASRDMPIVATVGVATASLQCQRGDPGAGAELLGAAASLRGSVDATHPEVARVSETLSEALGEEGFAERFAHGRALDRDAALALLDAAAVGAER